MSEWQGSIRVELLGLKSRGFEYLQLKLGISMCLRALFESELKGRKTSLVRAEWHELIPS